MRKQYHFRSSPKGLLAWDVNKLIEKSSSLPIKKVRLSNIRELDECFWYDLGGVNPTCRNVVEHARLIQEADLQYPIILSKDGRVMDGMHRVCKALLEGHKNLNYVQFEEEILPDHIGVDPDELSYD
jgi:hypothetical protein